MRLDDSNKAWMLLLDDEKLALTLHYSSSKSSWQAGEIMKKAHYKYLEIKARAEKFLRIFTDYFVLYQDQLIPHNVNLDPDFRKYLELIILKRKKVNEAIKDIDNPLYSKINSRDKELVIRMDRLKIHPKPGGRNLYNLIKDFDRWNNFRILPRIIQEPSAFKRRNKNRHRKRVKKLLELNTQVIKSLKNNYSYTPKAHNASKIGYVPIISNEAKQDKHIITIHAITENIKYMSSNELYIFKKKSQAQEFIDLIDELYRHKDKHCREGQMFWPVYRDLIKLAINYSEVDKVIPSRKMFQDEADIDADAARARKIKRQLK